MALLRFVWERKRTSYFLMLLFIPFFVLSGVTEVYLPKAVLAELENKQSVSHFVMVLGSISLVLIVSLYIKDMIYVRLQNSNILLHKDLQMDYIRKLIFSEYKYLENHKFLSLRNQAKSIIYSIYSTSGNSSDYFGMFLTTITDLISEAVIIFIYFIILWQVSHILIIFILATVLIVGVMSFPEGKKIQIYEDKAGLAWRKAQYLTERIGDFSLAKDMRLYSMKKWLMSLLDKYIGERLHYKGCALRNECCWSIARMLVVRIQNIVVYGYLIYKTFDGSMVASDLVLYAGVVSTISHLVIDVASNIAKMHHVHLNFERVQDFLNYGEDMKLQGFLLHTEGVTLKAEHVSFKFPDSEEMILKDLNFSVKTGDKIAIVGLNGAGKTTLMKLICGLLEPTEGRILLNGRDMKEMTAEERYTWFSCAFQDISFLPLSVRENISMCTKEETDDMKVSECLKNAGMYDKVMQLPDGPDSLMEKDINEDAVDFSGGERQRLILARALYRDTSVLILDEPTAALDPIAENEMYQKYAEFAKDKISFFVSHRLSSTLFCDSVFLINDGRIEESGTHGELLIRNGLYAKMFSLQAHYYNNGEEF